MNGCAATSHPRAAAVRRGRRELWRQSESCGGFVYVRAECAHGLGRIVLLMYILLYRTMGHRLTKSSQFSRVCSWHGKTTVHPIYTYMRMRTLIYFMLAMLVYYARHPNGIGSAGQQSLTPYYVCSNVMPI